MGTQCQSPLHGPGAGEGAIRESFLGEAPSKLRLKVEWSGRQEERMF